MKLAERRGPLGDTPDDVKARLTGCLASPLRVARDIYLLRIPLPGLRLGHLNAYLVIGDEGCLLVDTGLPLKECLDSLLEELSAAGVKPTGVSLVVVTHSHADHIRLATKPAKMDIGMAVGARETVMLTQSIPGSVERVIFAFVSSGMLLGC